MRRPCAVPDCGKPGDQRVISYHDGLGRAADFCTWHALRVREQLRRDGNDVPPRRWTRDLAASSPPASPVSGPVASPTATPPSAPESSQGDRWELPTDEPSVSTLSQAPRTPSCRGRAPAKHAGPRKANCVKCGERRIVRARGLCRRCYKAARKRGKVDEWGLPPKAGARPKVDLPPEPW